MKENLENQEQELKGEENIAAEEEMTKEDLNSSDQEEVKEESQVEDKKEEDELKMFKKTKEENKKLQNELETLKDRLLRLTAEYDNYRKELQKKKKEFIQMHVQMY